MSFLAPPVTRAAPLRKHSSGNPSGAFEQSLEILGQKAQALATRGADVVKADLDDPASLSPAFEDAHVIFAVSDFWGLYGDPANPPKAAAAAQPLNVWAANHETQQLKDVIDAAAKVPSLGHFVLSSLSDATKWSGGKYSHVYHFDSKAKAETYGRENHPELWAKTSIFQAGYFLNNFVSNPITLPRKVPCWPPSFFYEY